jgi:mannosyl-oligosaccharide alpha-1,2-mannosidase
MSRFLVMRYTQSPRVRQFLASGIAATLFLVAIYTYWSPSTSQRVYPIPDRTSPNTPPSEPELDSTKIWAERAEQVRKAFLHCYRGYEKYAFPHDE